MSTFNPSDVRITAELARVLHHQAPASLLGGFVIAIALLATVWNQADVLLVLTWVVLYIATSAIRISLWWHYRPKIEDDATAIAWQKAMMKALIASGLAWGAGAWLFTTPQLSEIFTPLLIIYSVLIAGAIGSLAAVVSMYVFYSLPVALIVCWRLYESSLFLPVHAVGYFLFVLVCIQYVRNQQRYIIESTGLKLEREALVAKLMERSRLLTLEAQRADAASEAKSRFLAVASHDLAQPMHALELFMSALKKEKDEEKRSRLINSAAESTRVISDMFSALLDLSRLDADAIQVSLQQSSLRELTDLMQREFQPQIEAKGLQFQYEAAEFSMNVDPVLMQRMLRNLLNNALQYTDSGGIELSAALAGDHIELKIIDSGQGMSAEQLQQIFNEHYQGEGSTGLGLGLALVKGFADLQDISIRAESRVGSGSTFTLQIPLYTAAPEPMPAAKEDNVRSGLRVILIEDDEPTRFAIISLLEQWQARHLSGSSWSEIERQLPESSFQPDVIVSDYHLSQYENALDVLDKVKATFTDAPPMIVVTGNRSSELGEVLGNLNITRLIKPVNADELKRTISKVTKEA